MLEAQGNGGQRYLGPTPGRRRNYLTIRPTATLHLEEIRHDCDIGQIRFIASDIFHLL